MLMEGAGKFIGYFFGVLVILGAINGCVDGTLFANSIHMEVEISDN